MILTMIKTWTLIGTILFEGSLRHQQVILTGIQSKAECTRVAEKIEAEDYACTETYTPVYVLKGVNND